MSNYTWCIYTVVFENRFLFFLNFIIFPLPLYCSFSVALPPTATLTFTQLLSPSLLCLLLVPSVLVHYFILLFVHRWCFSQCACCLYFLCFSSPSKWWCAAWQYWVGRFHKLVKTGYIPECIDLQPTYGGCLTCQSIHAVISLDCSMWGPVDPWECYKPVGEGGSLLPSFSPSSSRLRPCSWNCLVICQHHEWKNTTSSSVFRRVPSRFCLDHLVWWFGFKGCGLQKVLRVASDSELFLHLQRCSIGPLLHSCRTLKTATSNFPPAYLNLDLCSLHQFITWHDFSVCF